MPESKFLIDAIVILAAAVLGVALSQRLKLGPVLGYLAAGLAIGPTGLGLVSDTGATHALAELGVVFLLFTVGLELPLERIRVMPKAIFWLGAAQVLVTGAAIGGVVLVAGGNLGRAVVIGGALALSSTAIVLRILADRSELNSRFGRAAFGVLLIQDLAVGPLIVIVLALKEAPDAIALALGLAVLKAIAAMVVILGIGRLALRPLFNVVAATRSQEVFIAFTLLVALCAGVATSLAGLSMAFGALLAGMLLADTLYRHQVAVDIEPFRGLLLGLFFMTVGMALDVGLLERNAVTIALLVLCLIAGKAAIAAGLAWLLMLPPAQALRLGLLLSQGGEFAFVLLSVGRSERFLTLADQQQIVVVVIVSMMLTPLLAELGRRLVPRVERRIHRTADTVPADPLGLMDHVILAGFGRVGRAVAQRLTDAGVDWVALDADPYRIAQARRQGHKAYFGDASRPEILDALGLAEARAVVVAIDNPRAALQLVALLHYVLPEVRVLARAYDEEHAAELRRAGAAAVVPEPAPIGAIIAAMILDPAAGGEIDAAPTPADAPGSSIAG